MWADTSRASLEVDLRLTGGKLIGAGGILSILAKMIGLKLSQNS
jgi:hypothetical protein